MSEFASCWWRSPESVYVTVQVTKCAQKRQNGCFSRFSRQTIFVYTLIISGMMIHSACRLVEIMTLVCTTCVSKGIAISWKWPHSGYPKMEQWLWKKKCNKMVIFWPILKSFGMQVGTNQDYHRPNFQPDPAIAAWSTGTKAVLTANL